jgi:O-antigen ligase
MADSTHNHTYAGLHPPASGGLSDRIGEQKVALAVGVVAASVAALFVIAHWSVVLVGVVAAFALSALEIEAFLLVVIFLLPVGWVLDADVLLRNIPIAVRLFVSAGFFFGSLLRGRLTVAGLFSSSVSKASVLLVCIIFGSVALAPGRWQHESVRSAYAFVSYVGFFFFIWSWLDSQQRLQRVLYILLWSTLFTSVFAAFQEIAGSFTSLWSYLNPGEEFLIWNGRVTSFLSHPNALAGYLNLVLPLALGIYQFGKNQWRKLAGLTLGLGLVALICTQSLGGLMAFASVVALAIFCFVESWRKRVLLLLSVAMIAFGFYMAREILNPFHAGEAFGYDAAGRVLLWNVAWDLFAHSPIMGVGWGNFVTLYADYLHLSWLEPDVVDVNNLYLQFLAETGILGIVTFLSLVFISAKEAWRQWRSAGTWVTRALSFGVLGAILSVLVHGLVDSLFRVSAQFGTLFWTLLALLVANGALEAQRRARMCRLPLERGQIGV